MKRSTKQKASTYCSVCGRRTTPNNRTWRASHGRSMNTCWSKACKETGSH
jgi:hypothetical protein